MPITFPSAPSAVEISTTPQTNFPAFSIPLTQPIAFLAAIYPHPQNRAHTWRA
jgi:hypothetical protein